MPATTWIDPAALAANGVIKNAPATLWEVDWVNEGAASRWLMIFDASSVPSNGALPVYVWPISPSEKDGFTFGKGRRFATGIVWAISSTNGTLTIDSGALFWVNAEIA